MTKVKDIKLSAALAVFNEEENIMDCLLSLKAFVDEIVVVDGNSRDRTAQLAKNLGAKVISTTNKTMFHINKNMAIENCSGDWILLMDADERISKQLAAEIKNKIKENPKENGFWINRKNWFLGGFLNKGGAYPDSVIRLFRRGKGRLPEISVHEQVKIDGSIGQINADILHLADPSFYRYLMRANRYTSQTAAKFEREKIGKNPLVFAYFTTIKPFTTFLKIYLRHKGYEDGFRGFVWALFSGSHFFISYVKYWTKDK